MTKKEYLQHLEQALQGYDRSFIEEILDNYEEHFDAGLRNGRTEQEICDELGAVENLMKDIEDMLGDMDIRTHELEKFTAIEPGQNEYGNISHIELALVSMGVKLMPSQDNQLHVYLEGEGDKSKYIEESISNDKYYAKEMKMSGRNNEKLVRLFFLGGFERSKTLIVEAPKKLEMIKIKTLSGDLDLRDVCTEALNLESLSGDILLNNIKATTSLIKSSSGDINLNNAEGNEMLVQSMSGDIELQNVAAQESGFSSISGDVNLKQVKAVKAKVKTTSGDVRISNGEFDNFDFNGTSGDMNGTFFTKNVYARTISGDIKMNVERRGRKLFANAKSVSGSVRIQSDITSDEGQNHDQIITAYASSVSGSIRVE